MLWFWIACSVKVPDYLVDPYTFAHPQCSEQDHLRAVGFNAESSTLAQQHARSRSSKVSLPLLNRFKLQRPVLNNNKRWKPLLQIMNP